MKMRKKISDWAWDHELAICIALIAICFLLMISPGIASWFEDKQDPCVVSHTEQQWYQPPPVYMKVGTVMMPVNQPGHMRDVTVCDQRESDQP